MFTTNGSQGGKCLKGENEHCQADPEIQGPHLTDGSARPSAPPLSTRAVGRGDFESLGKQYGEWGRSPMGISEVKGWRRDDLERGP